jgi:hypothetical protein
MRSSPLSRPQWQRLVLGVLPMAVLAALAVSATTIEVAAGESAMLDVPLLAICLTVLIPALVKTKAVFSAERRTSPEMQARYEALHALFAATRDEEAPLVNVRAGVVILGVDQSRRWRREVDFVRCGTEQNPVMRNGIQYRVYERFTLHESIPVVLHEVDAVSIQVGPDGGHHAQFVPCPRRTRRGGRRTARMVRRTGIDLATIPDLDRLIDQIRSACAAPIM